MLEQQEKTQEDIAEEEEKKQTLTLEYIGTAVAGFKTNVCLYGYHGCYFSVWDNLETQNPSNNSHTATNTHPTCQRAKRDKHV